MANLYLATLTIYLHTCRIDDLSIEQKNVTFGITPFALTAYNRYVNTVLLFLDNNTKADAISS